MRSTRAVLVTLSVAMLANPLGVPSAVADEQTLICASDDGRYRYCRVETSNQAKLTRQISKTRCEQGTGWGFDRHGVWVDHGCRAEFTVGHGTSDKDKALVVGAAASIAILAAIANNRKQHQEEIPAWSVGTFRGRDEIEAADVEITILPGGTVKGSAGDHEFEGSFAGNVLKLGKYQFRVEQSGNGFSATDQANAGHRILFARSGSGY